MSWVCPRCKRAYAAPEVDCPADGVGLVPDRSGERVGAHTLTALLGGSSGDEVWEARDDAGAPVAVRLLAPVGGRRDEDRLFSLRRAKRLNHPRIARVLDTGLRPDGVRWVTAERVQGQRLSDLASPAGLDLVPALHVADQLLDLLDFAHERGVVHGTLGSGKVFVTPDALDAWRIVLTGFGLGDRRAPTPDLEGDEARRLLHPRSCYRAPEQVMGQRCLPQSDVYAVGVVLFELLTGAVPFEGVAPEEIDRRHLFALPPPLAMAAPERWLPEGLDAVVRRALAKEPDRRYPGVRQMRAALAHAITTADLDTHPAASSAPG